MRRTVSECGTGFCVFGSAIANLTAPSPNVTSNRRGSRRYAHSDRSGRNLVDLILDFARYLNIVVAYEDIHLRADTEFWQVYPGFD